MMVGINAGSWQDVPAPEVVLSPRWSLVQKEALLSVGSHGSGGFGEIDKHECMRFLVSAIYFSGSRFSLFMPGTSC